MYKAKKSMQRKHGDSIAKKLYYINIESTFDCFNFNHVFAYNNITFKLYNGPYV